MKRLYLTDEQTKTVVRALRNQIISFYKCANEMHNERAFQIEEKYINEANALDEILDIIDTED